MQRTNTGPFVMKTTPCLSVNCNDFSFGRCGYGLYPSNEAFLKRGWFEGGKDSGKGVVRWDAVFQFQKGFEPFFFTFPELFHLCEVFGSANRGKDRNRND